MSCLIIGNHTQGLGILRCLSQINVETNLINEQKISLSRFSKYLTKYHFIKRKTIQNLYKPQNTEYLLQILTRMVTDNQRWVLFGINEDIINFIYQNRTELEKNYLIPNNKIDLIIDKYKFADEIIKIGLPTPKTFLLKDFKKNVFKEGDFVCKGRLGNKYKNITSEKGKEIKTGQDLDKFRIHISVLLNEDEIIVQEKIRNNHRVLSCCGLAIKGEIFQNFQYIKLRQHPNEFGTGTFLKSIENREVFTQSVAIIKHFEYTGIYEIEYILDTNGKYYVIEMNPRTWKSIHFAQDCGQNLCATYYNYMIKGIIPEYNFDYSIGKTWVDLGTDLPLLIKNRQFKNLGYNKDTFYCVLDFSDIIPFIAGIFLFPFIYRKY